MKESIPFPQQAVAAWEATRPLLTADVSYSGDIMSRLAMSSVNTPLTLFVPWGVRPEGQFGSSESQALDVISTYQKLLGRFAIPSRVLIMPADVYATEVNNYAAASTRDYFSTVEKESKARNFDVLSWSFIRKNNQALYDKTLQWEANSDSLWRTTPKILWGELLSSARARSKRDTEQAIAKAAFDYLKERVAEARVIDKVYKPIKLSMVSPKKDDVVDRDLPRLYLLPKNLRFPWITKKTYER